MGIVFPKFHGLIELFLVLCNIESRLGVIDDQGSSAGSAVALYLRGVPVLRETRVDDAARGVGAIAAGACELPARAGDVDGG